MVDQIIQSQKAKLSLIFFYIIIIKKFFSQNILNVIFYFVKQYF